MRGPLEYQIEHVTRYIHSQRASTSHHMAYLHPRTFDGQRVLSHALDISPAPAHRDARTDYFGNIVEYFDVVTPYTDLRVQSRSAVAVVPRDREPPEFDDDGSTWEQVRDALASPAFSGRPDVVEFTYASPYVESSADMAAFARTSFVADRPFVDAARDLMHRIHRDFTFDSGATSITTPVSRVLATQHGVCQDFAHLQIACMRALGLAARYVSGYLLTDPPPGQPRLQGADASHAWLSVFSPAGGWVDLDPTNDVTPNGRHITLAWGRDFGDVSPLRGVVLGGGHHELRVGVSVTPLE